MRKKAIQNFYRDEYAHCFGCGRLNKDGLQIKSYWDGKESKCSITPDSCFTGGFPGYLYGGMIASLIDCHSAATASAAKLGEDGHSLGDSPLSRFVTASLRVDYKSPTPMGKKLELLGRVKEMNGRKIIVTVSLSAEGKIRAVGEVVLIQLPER